MDDPIQFSDDDENGVDDWLAITKPSITKKPAKKPAAAVFDDSDDDDDLFPKKKGVCGECVCVCCLLMVFCVHVYIVFG